MNDREPVATGSIPGSHQLPTSTPAESVLGRSAAPTTYRDVAGALGDATPYLMRVPSNWNGTLIRDLDLAGGKANGGPFLHLLEQGYAFVGTARRAARQFGYHDPARDVVFLDMLLDLFGEQFAQPDRVIQVGCSGGGHVGQLTAERSDRVDGVVATGSADRVWLANSYLDLWVSLKALIAPELPIRLTHTAQSLASEFTFAQASRDASDWELTFAWRQAINAAQRTVEGRARIALAMTIGQWPSWANHIARTTGDVAAIQSGWYRCALEVANFPGGGFIRDMIESAAGFGIRSHQLAWNSGVDYQEFFENGNTLHKAVVRQLYKEANLDLASDLERLQMLPRISADPKAIEYWTSLGRSVSGNPQVPMMLAHTIGDPGVPVSLVQGYVNLVRKNGKDDLLRIAIVDSSIHCDFNTAETAAMVDTLNRRLDTDRWGTTDPDNLNGLGRSLDQSSTPRFIPFDHQVPARYNRTWTQAEH